MDYRRFGKTEIQMPVFSCGGMRYQQGWKDVPFPQIEKANQENLEATIRRSVELGINHIETARGYGTSEMQLGKILPQFKRDELIVQTKVAVLENGDAFLKDFEKSMAYLQLDRVDLLSIHGINNLDLLDTAIKPNGCLEMARKLQKAGRVGHVGFSTHADCHCICKAIQTQVFGGFDYVNLHWYYINPSNWQAVLQAREKDMGVFIISPNDKGGMLYQPTQQWLKACQGVDPMVFNDWFCLLKKEVHTLSIGASCPSDFDVHVAGLKELATAEKKVKAITAHLEDLMMTHTGAKHPYQPCGEMPSWEKVPSQMNLQVMIWLWHMAKAWGMIDYGKMRYNLLGNAEHWFPGEHAGKLDEISQQQLEACVKGLNCEKWIFPRLLEAHQMLCAEKTKRLSETSEK